MEDLKSVCERWDVFNKTNKEFIAEKTKKYNELKIA